MKKKSRTSKRSWTDPDDAPTLTRDWFEQADFYHGDKLVRRGRGRPPAAHKKVPLNMRVDAEVMAALRAQGRGWQTKVNKWLREIVL